MTDLAKLDELAKSYYKNLDFENALVCYSEAFSRYPYLSLAYSNYCKILAEQGYPELAIPFGELALKLDPNDANAHMNLAYSVLRSGDLDRGWVEFECRWRFKHHEHVLLSYDKPRWEGESLINKTLLITCEEGDGDNLQFIRYVKLFNYKIIIQTEKQLVRLFQASFPDCTVIKNNDPLPEYDYWVPILSLPRILRITYESFIPIENYLSPSNLSKKKWKKIMGKSDKIRIGICYRGRTRDYSFTDILDFIKDNSEYEFVTIQGIYRDNEYEQLLENNVVSYVDDITDWDDTAAMLQHLDYVITVDSGLAHMAGSMNVPTFILNDRYTGCWRWLVDKDDTQWYPSVTIVRQNYIKGFSDQLDRIAKKIGAEAP